MEVHHHTHHPKKWKEYFWEFFMLFMAVFCGFLAEIQVEHYVEHQRERKYMADLVSDIHQDTAWIHGELLRTERQLRGYDSLTTLLNQPDYQEKAPIAYRLYDDYSPLLTPLLTDQTITQLRNSGNLRLIKSVDIAKQIDQYWTWQQAIKTISNRVEQRVDMMRELGVQIFDEWQIDSATITNSTDLTLSAFKRQPSKFFSANTSFLSKDPLVFKKYSNMRINVSLSARLYRWALMELEKDGLKLIRMIEDEYKLKQAKQTIIK
jgi:hypothetical protein